MSDCANKAVSGEKESFFSFRKITACVIALTTGRSGVEAAALADKYIFQKQTEYAVGQGKLTEEEAVKRIVDRGASQLALFLHVQLESMVNVGCRVAGGFIGALFGPQSIMTGQKIGGSIAKVLNTQVSVLIDKGIEQLKKVAPIIYQKGKELLKAGFKKIVNHLVN